MRRLGSASINSSAAAQAKNEWTTEMTLQRVDELRSAHRSRLAFEVGNRGAGMVVADEPLGQSRDIRNERFETARSVEPRTSDICSRSHEWDARGQRQV